MWPCGSLRSVEAPPPAEPTPRARKPPFPPHQATLFLEGALDAEGFRSARLPPGCSVATAGYALTQPEAHRGEGVFVLWPRTDGEGRLQQAWVSGRLQRPLEGPELVVHGLLLHADRRKLVVAVEPRSGEAFRLILPRAPSFTARLQPRKAYRLEGTLQGGKLRVERAFPLGQWWLGEKGQKPRPEPIEGDRNPYREAPGKPGKKAPLPASSPPPAPSPPPSKRPEPPRPAPRKPRAKRDLVRVWRAPEEEATPGSLGLPPPLPKGQVMGLVGEGPYYLVLKPMALDQWWTKVERLLPEFPRRYEVRLYPDGSRAVVAWDLEALKTWYKRVLRG
jgi:hypothetical protein